MGEHKYQIVGRIVDKDPDVEFEESGYFYDDYLDFEKDIYSIYDVDLTGGFTLGYVLLDRDNWKSFKYIRAEELSKYIDCKDIDMESIETDDSMPIIYRGVVWHNKGGHSPIIISNYIIHGDGMIYVEFYEANDDGEYDLYISGYYWLIEYMQTKGIKAVNAYIQNGELIEKQGYSIKRYYTKEGEEFAINEHDSWGLRNINAKCVSIPEFVTTDVITQFMFLGCTNIERLEIPKYITKIEYGAFKCCTNLKEVEIWGTIREVEEYFYEREDRNYIAPFANCPIERVILHKQIDPITFEKLGFPQGVEIIKEWE